MFVLRYTWQRINSFFNKVQFATDDNNIVFSCQYHVVFCPKYRRPVLVDGVDKRLQAIVHEVAAEIPFEVESLSIHADHVHLLLNCAPQLSIHQVVKRVKSRSSSYLRQEFPWLKSRLPTLWSNSYFVATVGGAPLDVIRRYIEDQRWRTGG